ncbi:MAG: FAD-binding oxidoreductase [Gammaproteobacteria bacterium]
MTSPPRVPPQPTGLITEASPRQFFDALPEAVDVVIIGAGVIGVCTAFFLAEQGVKVLICEKGQVAGEQSSRNWGWVRQQGRDADELPIMMESLRIWRGLAERTGEDLGFTRAGVLYLAENEAKMADYAQWLEIAKQHQLDTRLLGRAEVEALVQCRPGQWLGGLFTASDGRAEPWQAVPGLARAAHRLGVKIIENCAVRALDVAGGQVAGVITEHGRVRAERVVLAGGAWSSLFARSLGLELPQLSVRATVVRTGAAPLVFNGNAADGKLAFRRRQDGGYTLALSDYHEHYIGPQTLRFARLFWPSLRASWRHLRVRFAAPAGLPGAWRTSIGSADQVSPFETLRVLNPDPAPGVAARIKARLGERLPALRGVEITDAWAGMIDTMPDAVPVIDAAPRPSGLFIGTGFSGHGFGIGPGAGRVLAALVQGRPPGHRLQRFRFARFADGSVIRVGPSL